MRAGASDKLIETALAGSAIDGQAPIGITGFYSPLERDHFLVPRTPALIRCEDHERVKFTAQYRGAVDLTWALQRSPAPMPCLIEMSIQSPSFKPA